MITPHYISFNRGRGIHRQKFLLSPEDKLTRVALEDEYRIAAARRNIASRAEMQSEL